MKVKKRTAAFLISFAILFVLPVGCISSTGIYGCLRASSSKLDKGVDRLFVIPFSYSPHEASPCLMITDKARIKAWRGAYDWTNAEEICCDEYTTYEIIAFNGHERRHRMSYEGVISGYNNPEFNTQQSLLVAELKLSVARNGFIRFPRRLARIFPPCASGSKPITGGLYSA